MGRPPPPPPGNERRRHPRFELVAQIEVHAGGEVLLVDVGDISAGGMRVELAHTEIALVKPGDLLRVVVDLGTDDLHFEADARVARVLPISARKPGFAVEWTSLDEAAARALERILSRAARA